MEAKNKHLLVVSVDAMVYEDLALAKDLPAIGRILREGSRVDRMTTIYPSLTHPVHASIMTGCPAGVTGVYGNAVFGTGKTPAPWVNYLSQVKCETIFHAAHRAGLSTAACRWPVTAGGGDVIDYLVPEVLDSDTAGRENDVPGVYREMGTSECLMELVEEGLRRHGIKNSHPDYDAMEIEIAAGIIRRYRPNLLFVHPGHVDHVRHKTGVFSESVNEAVRLTNQWIGMLLDAIRDAGIEDTTDVVVMSDHGQLNVVRTVRPNVFLAEEGLIRLNEDGTVRDFDAFIASGGLSAPVYLSRPDDPALKERVYRLLSRMADEKIYGFERVFTKEETWETYGLSGPFSFFLETDGYSGFSESVARPPVVPTDAGDYRTASASHGHQPHKGPKPPFLCAGPSFAQGVELAEGSILDAAPTFAKLFGLTLPDAWGKPMDALLR